MLTDPWIQKTKVQRRHCLRRWQRSAAVGSGIIIIQMLWIRDVRWTGHQPQPAGFCPPNDRPGINLARCIPLVPVKVVKPEETVTMVSERGVVHEKLLEDRTDRR